MKGIHQNLSTLDVVNSESMKEILETYHCKEPTTFKVDQRQFVRSHVPLATVRDVERPKKWQFTYDKRQIVDHVKYETLPFGFK